MLARQHAAAALVAALAVVLLPIVTSAQDVSGPNLKAAYIYRFALFTEWPETVLPPGGPLTACVVGDMAMRDALERTVKGVTVNGRSVVVTFGQPDQPPPLCHILYVSGVSSAQATRLVAGLSGVPVLTMSDREGFNKMGGIAEFFYDAAGLLRFSIDRDAVAQSRLQLSSRLLQLSRPRR